MAQCCDGDGSQQALQQCFAKCGGPLEQATQLYQAETQRFQQKVQRCAATCQDDAQVRWKDTPWRSVLCCDL